MIDLMRSEWRRFRGLALGLALAHGLALLLLSRMTEIAQLGYQDQGAMLTLYMALGLTLALLQVGSYRKVSRWLWLIHRPVPPGQIFAALAGAALAHLGIAILAPLLLFLAATDLLTAQVVDVRHYAAGVLVLTFAMMAWMAGAHAAASRHKAAVGVLLAPMILALHMASVWALLLPVLACLAWLALVARQSVRADRNAPIARTSVLVLTALPLQLGFFLVAFHLSRAGVALVDLLGRSNPGRTVLATDTDVNIDSLLRSMSQNFLAKGLEGSDDPRAASWRAQLPLLPMAGLSPDIARFPVRHQFGNLGEAWFDNSRNIQWTFSHDRMRFRGRDPLSGASRGWWGADGISAAEPFATVPASGMMRSTLYAIDHEAQGQHDLIRLPAGEWFIGRPVQALGRVLVLTNRRVLAYLPDRAALSRFAPYRLDWALTLPERDPPPIGVDMYELFDGWLVSLFYFDDREFDGFGFLTDPWQQVVHIDANGQAAVVAERHAIGDVQVRLGRSVAVPEASWWVSPPLYALAHLPGLLNTGLTQPSRFRALPQVPLFYPLALGLILGSVAAAYGWLRGTRAARSRRRLWLVMCAVMGLPAFLSLVCLEPRERWR